MTHTLHRVGTRENLSDDFVFLYMPAFDINSKGSGPKIRKFLEIMLRHNPVNLGDGFRANMLQSGIDDVLDNIRENGTVVNVAFDNEDDALQALKEAKEADLGLSLVISGLFDRVTACCQQAGIHRHAATYSLGIWGKTEKLPPKEALEIATMCGHGMVAAGLVYALADDVKAGKKSADEAANIMAKQCPCGIFNPTRAAKLLTVLVGA
jgi:hypothetical protein